jgi:putative membrane protein insertion efficiency factor
MKTIIQIPRLVGISLVRIYQFMISPLFGSCCRYSPSCSHYAIEALKRHGFMGGSYLAARRVLRCHPYARAGCDPVPDSIFKNYK